MKASFAYRIQGYKPAPGTYRWQGAGVGSGTAGFKPFERILIFQYVLTLKNQ
jgi:hypothetical protein